MLLTATHDVADDDRDGAVLCDADLAVLAAGAARYSSYVEGVRREYGHLDDATFADGRAAVLSVAARPAGAVPHGARPVDLGARGPGQRHRRAGRRLRATG